MRFTAALAFAALSIAGPAHPGAARCWLENGAVVVSAAYRDITGDFILDLAAPESLLHVTVAQAHGVTGDTARGGLVLAGERVGDARLQVTDLDTRSIGFVTGIDGVLGADVLAPFVVEISPRPCRLVLRRRRTPPMLGAVRMKVRMIAGVPTVRAAVSDGRGARRGWFAIDTASLGVRVADARLTRTPPGGVDPASPPARLRALSLGGRLYEQVPAGLLPDAPLGVDGAIGQTIWSRYRLRLDERRGWLDLGPDP